MLQLKGYQERSLDALEQYFRVCIEHGAKKAFVLETGRPYLPVPNLPELPYVCLRVPTGGGKTFMACHALGLAAKDYLQADRTVCLWLVPSNAIREQTLAALRNRQHAYRQALDASFSSQVRVMDLAEALYVQRGTLDGDTAIIVATLAALRVTDVEGRKVYEAAGALSHHFTGLDASLEALLEREENGVTPHSLANVLRLRRPVVIMDEAHNARTPLSFETLARFNPSCVIEFTATPETTHRPEQGLFASNVLHHVSAAELKAEEMVKLPIKLRTRGDWKEVVGEAVALQRSLEKAAQEDEAQTGEYLRPIVLLQAQPHSKDRETLTVEVVKRCLLDDFKVPEEQVAVATGETREIKDVDLFSRSCQLRFIITVQALKEGWDCSFAYVLCSVAEISSSRAVEQILGRILRLPRARWKQNKELNCAYAFAASPRFIEAATALKDALVENGFEKLEANDLVVQQEEPCLPLSLGPLFDKAAERVSQKPDFSVLDKPLLAKVEYEEETGQITVTGSISQEEKKALQDCFTSPQDREAIERLYLLKLDRQVGSPAKAEVRPEFKVPLLAIRDGDQLEVFEDSHFAEIEWNLADCDARLTEAEFPSQQAAGEVGEVDVTEAGRVELRFVNQLHEQLALLTFEPGWTVASLANWLDRQIPHIEIVQSQSALFIHKALSYLIESRGMAIEQLARQKFRLRTALEKKIDEHRQSQAKKAYNALLFGAGSGKIEVSEHLYFTFEENRYAPNSLYANGYTFQKHYFPRVGDLESQGEEFECAVFLDTHPKVWYWVRNLPRRDYSFWLQTSTDKFYPDFVALLNDGRILVVELKGGHLWGSPIPRKSASWANYGQSAAGAPACSSCPREKTGRRLKPFSKSLLRVAPCSRKASAYRPAGRLIYTP